MTKLKVLYENNKFYRFFMDWIVPALVAVILVLIIKEFLLFQINVPTSSMAPTIEPGDRMIATRIYDFKKIKRGDMLVFQSDELDEKLIKRLIGLPGDVVELKNGETYINGEKIDEPYVVNKSVGDRDQKFEVPEKSYLFLGDNRSGSFDARFWKNQFIPEDKIEAKAQFRIFPFKSFGKLK